LSVEKGTLLSSEKFPAFFMQLLFCPADVARREMHRILLLFDPKDLQAITLDNLTDSVKGHCLEYFELVGSIVIHVEDPIPLWHTLFDALRHNLFTKKENLNLRNCNGDADLEFSVNELTAGLANAQFVTGITQNLLNLLRRIEGEVPKLRRVLRFYVKEIIFNIRRYVPNPFSGFTFLTELLKRRPKELTFVIEHLQSLHAVAPELSGLPLHLTSTAEVRGIGNMGATCYFNSSMQQLFRVHNLRDSILSYVPAPNVNVDEDWVSQLVLFWTRLIYSPSFAVDASPFVRIFKGFDGQPINPR
jgi:hypothetical protein